MRIRTIAPQSCKNKDLRRGGKGTHFREITFSPLATVTTALAVDYFQGLIIHFEPHNELQCSCAQHPCESSVLCSRRKLKPI